MRRSLSTVIACVTVLAAAACGGSSAKSSPKVVVRNGVQLVAATADATARAKTAKVAVTANVTGDALPQNVAIDMDGAIALDGSAADYTMNLGNIVPNAPANSRIEAREVGGVLYMDFGAMTRAIGGSAANDPSLKNLKWVKIDISGLTGGGSSGGANSPASFTQYLQYLRGVAKNGVHTVSHDTVRGVPTTHFRAQIDPAKSIAAAEQRLAKLSPVLRAAAQQGLDALRNSKAPLTANVWIDNDGLTRRLVIDLPFPVPGAGSNAVMKMSMDLYDFGTPVNVQAPPPSEVTDLQSLMNAGQTAT